MEYKITKEEVERILHRLFGAEVTYTDDGVILKTEDDIKNVLDYLAK